VKEAERHLHHSLSLSRRSKLLKERERKGRDLGSEAGIVVGIVTSEVTNIVAALFINSSNIFIYWKWKVRFTPRRLQRAYNYNLMGPWNLTHV